jgi:hypothetical protein
MKRKLFRRAAGVGRRLKLAFSEILKRNIKMARLISTSVTVIYKLIFVPLGISFFILCTILLITQEGSRWFFFKSWVFLALWNVPVLLFCLPLKEVIIEGNQLVVSNFVKKLRINASNIVDVTQRSWCGFYSRFVRIHFKNPTVFGDKISFIPKMYLIAIGNQHPIVDELRQLARLSDSQDNDKDSETRVTRGDNSLESDS